MGVRPERMDVALSAGVVLAGLVEILLVPVEGQSSSERLTEVMALVVIATCFTFRRSLPVWSAVLALFGLTTFSLTGVDSRAWEVAVVIIAVYSCARHSSARGTWTVLAAAVVYGLVIFAIEGGNGFWMYVGNFTFYLALTVLIPGAAGVALRRREELSRYDAERAVDDERVRIARELHDVVGHALGVIVVQADGERALLPADVPDTTRETLTSIAAIAREALDDVRRLLVIMRTTGDTLGPQPGLADVPKLVEGMAAVGLPTELVIEGDPRSLPPAVDLSAYRVVQEALTNSLRHSRNARATVVVRYLAEAIDIEINDDGQAVANEASRGFGLLGMRERVALFGGSVQAGPRATGGFSVAVELPSTGRPSDETARPRL